MSTYMYLVCEDHDPPLRASDESGQHDYDLPQIREDIANREAIVKLDPEFSDHFRRSTVRFLTRHTLCRIGIQDEYGERYPVVEGEAAPSVSHPDSASWVVYAYDAGPYAISLHGSASAAARAAAQGGYGQVAPWPLGYEFRDAINEWEGR